MKKLLASILTALWLGAPALANVPCAVPFTLVNGTLADATQVMANYNAIITCLTNAAAAGANSDINSLSALTTPIPAAGGGATTYIGGTSGGTANAQTVTPVVPTGFALTQGNTVIFKVGATNTAATTLAVAGTTAKNVFVMSPAGPQALIGGEMVLNDIAMAVYDGTEYQLLSTHAQFGGVGPLTTLASATTTDLGTIPSHNVSITGTTTITAFGSTATTSFPIYNIGFTGALTLTHNATSLILPSAANIVTVAGDQATAAYLGSGNWRVIDYTPVSGGSVVPATAQCGATGLTITNNTGTPTTSITVGWDSATLTNAAGLTATQSVPGSTVTLNSTTSGAVNQWDAARPTSAWGHIYLIATGPGGTFGSLGSASATAPTLPTGFTFKCRLGAMRFDASQNLLRTLQQGSWAQYIPTTATNTLAMPTMDSGTKGTNCATATPTYASVNMGTFIPPTASEVALNLHTNFNNAGAAAVIAAPNNSYAGTFNSASVNPPPLALNGAVGALGVVTERWLVENPGASPTVFWCSSAAGGALLAQGWKDKVNAQ